MKIALIGYGKMGKEIEKIAVERGHDIAFVVDEQNIDYRSEELVGIEAAIEFSTPDAAVQNIYKCFEAKAPVVVGTTGWYNEFENVTTRCAETNATLFHASNFSVGVNIFFELNRKLASMMNKQPAYDATMEETHHIHKKDAPSGTAITLAEGVISELEQKEKWINDGVPDRNELLITSIRADEVPGTHNIKYESEIDSIVIEHKAKSRKGFALGALLAAEWVANKTGVYSMKDMLQF